MPKALGFFNLYEICTRYSNSACMHWILEIWRVLRVDKEVFLEAFMHPQVLGLSLFSGGE
jgi:hypothetical protein